MYHCLQKIKEATKDWKKERMSVFFKLVVINIISPFTSNGQFWYGWMKSNEVRCGSHNKMQ